MENPICRDAKSVFVSIKSPKRSGNNNNTPYSSTNLILAQGAAGELSLVILAHTDAEERFNGHWSVYPLVSVRENQEIEQRGRGNEGEDSEEGRRGRRQCVKAAVAQT